MHGPKRIAYGAAHSPVTRKQSRAGIALLCDSIFLFPSRTGTEVPVRSTPSIEPSSLVTGNGVSGRMIYVVGSSVQLPEWRMIIAILILCVVLLLASAAGQPATSEKD
jgi:hypothetical protein